MDTKDIPNTFPTPWIPETDLQRCAVLGKTVEECGELLAIVGRCQIQGIDGRDPKTGKTNRQALTEEVGDVLARCQAIIQKFELDSLVISSRSENKFHFLNKWLALLDKNHDGWYPIDQVSLPPEVLLREMTLTLWLQPSAAPDDISKGRMITRAQLWLSEPDPQLIKQACHWNDFVAGWSLSKDFIVTHWRYENNPLRTLPVLVPHT